MIPEALEDAPKHPIEGPADFIEEPPDFGPEPPIDAPAEHPDSATELSPLDKLREDILRNANIKLPPINSDELAHFDDNWLDGAYDSKLLRSGDDLWTIPNAQELAVQLIGIRAAEPESIVQIKPDGMKTARAKVMIDVPALEEESAEDMALPEISEEASEEELLEYAKSHPTVRNLLRVFRGQITDVKKI